MPPCHKVRLRPAYYASSKEWFSLLPFPLKSYVSSYGCLRGQARWSVRQGRAGSCLVNGIECKNRTKNFYENIGVDFEFSTMYEKLTAKENLQFFSSLYEKKPRPIDELLEAVGLEQDADKRVADYSKGMKSRLNFISRSSEDICSKGQLALCSPSSTHV